MPYSSCGGGPTWVVLGGHMVTDSINKDVVPFSLSRNSESSSLYDLLTGTYDIDGSTELPKGGLTETITRFLQKIGDMAIDYGSETDDGGDKGSDDWGVRLMTRVMIVLVMFSCVWFFF